MSVPDQYIKNAISSCLASKLVYKEGTKFIEALPKHKLAEMALNYVKKKKEIFVQLESTSKSNLADAEKEKILKLLEAGGARPWSSLA
jgi:glutamate dehydrogenase